ncbi:peptidylprolyl isomerase [Haloflavibacter putidus]|uniref:Peptidylprolyl isomerase n=1 Tax=Haloflavibacter putidus TaxID=2576776 RepID=A0A507ZM92_9FLAO|nr:peptidylprolyl isomerase [Haloflavibacter putidus]
MHLNTRDLKFITKLLCSLPLLVFALNLNAQDLKDSTLVVTEKVPETAIAKIDSTKAFKRFKADGVAAVVGDYLILESDITKMREDMKNQGMSSQDITDCQLAGRLLENKLYAHKAEQDTTIIVPAPRLNSMVDQQLSRMEQQIGSKQKLLDFYRKESMADLRKELYTINKERELATNMQDRIIEDVEVTPEEVRTFFEEIPEDKRPKFGDEVEIAQLVIKPKIPKEEKQKVIDQLNEIRDDILENGASFATKAVLYSQDGTSTRGGQMTITREDPLDKTFKQIAFSLREGEISKPFKSDFGYHIVKLDKMRGQQLDIRHIILMPEVTDETVKAAKKRIDSIRIEITNNNISFDEAARKFSEEEETRGDGGKLINPSTGDTRFELTKVDPIIYDQVVNLEEGQVSLVLSDQTRTGRKFFKIITVTNRYPEHIANYSQDYSKIKELALREKQYEAIQKWQTETIAETYIKINGKYRECDFNSNWQKM